MNNMERSFIKICRGQKGITGLETAIILIAFVVVASVFAYTVLSAGLFSTQKSQEAVHSGLDESQSTLELKGAVIADGYGELVDCNGWINGDATNVTTFEQDTTNYNTAPGSLKIVDTEDHPTNGNTIIAYYVLDKPATLASGDAITIWIRNNDGANALDVYAGLELALDNDATHDATVTNWDETLAFTNPTSLAVSTASAITTAETTSLTSITAVGIMSKADYSTTSLQISIDDIKESVDGAPILSNCDSAWSVGANVTQTGEVTTKIEGTASIKLTTGAIIAAAQTLGGCTIPSRDLQNNSSLDFWIRCDEAVLGTELQLVTEDATADCTKAIPALTADEWLKVTWDLSSETDANLDAVTQVRLESLAGCSISSGAIIYLDIIETQPILSTTYTMNSYADQVVFTICNAVSGEPIDITVPSDDGSNDENGQSDGIIDSNDSTQTHRMVVNYSDAYQQYADLAWSATAIGYTDGDDLLEEGEKFQITVDLSYVNNNASQDDYKVGKNNTFTLELKPAAGATLIVQRTMPAVVKAVNNLW